MYDYEEACPISKASSVLGERWTLQIIREMMLGARRFCEFQRYLPRLSPSILNARLKSLEDNGIILRRRIPEQRGYEYLLTPAGKALRPVMIELGKWGMRWVFDSLVDEELSAVSLLRDIAVKIDRDELPAGDCVIQFNMPDLPETRTRYVLVKEDRARECDENPGYDVDVYINATLRTLTEIWYGRMDLRAACQSGVLEVVGAPAYTRNLARWFPVSQFAGESPPPRGA